MARARGSDLKFAGAFETTPGTAPASGFYLLPVVNEALGEEQGLIASDLIGQGREPLAPTLDVINDNGDVTVPVDLRAIGFWLKGLLGEPVTAAALAATGAWAFSAQPAANSTITVNGQAITFVTGTASSNQVQIGANLSATMTALASALNAHAGAQITPATYAAAGGNTLTVTHDTLGPSGNAFTLAASATSNAKPSAATLAGGANTHTFTSGEASLPSFSTEKGFPAVPSFVMGVLGRVNSFRVAAQRSGLLNATVNVIRKGELPATTTTAAGTPTEWTIERFAQFSGELKRAGVTLGGVTSADFTYSNTLEPIETIQPDGKIEDTDPGVVSITGTIEARYADDTLRDQAASGQGVDIAFGWRIANGKTISFTFHNVFLPKPKRATRGPTGVMESYAFQGAKSVTLGKSMTVVLTNDVANYN